MGYQKWPFHAKVAILHIILLSIIWALSVLVVNPSGEFPLNDDWSYCQVVKNIFVEGRFQLTGWISIPLVGQIAWGALFCIPFGFSFTALRISSLILGLIGVLSAYGILREAKARNSVAFFGAMLFAANPLYYEHAFTFMTDIPFTALALLSSYFYLRGFRREKTSDFLLGSVIAAWTTLIRQMGVVIPIAFAVAFLMKYGLNRKTFRKVFLHFLISIGPFVLYNVWLLFVHGFPAKYNAAGVRMSRALAHGLGEYLRLFIQRTSSGLIYIAVLILPFLILIFSAVKRFFKKRDTYILLGSVFCMVLIVTLVWDNQFMPLLRNVLFDLGLGPPHLRDVYVLGLPNWPRAPVLFWYLITVVGALGAAFLIFALISLFKGFIHTVFWTSTLDVTALFLFGMIVLYFLLIVIVGYYDRYLVFFPVLMSAMLLRLFPFDSINWRTLG